MAETTLKGNSLVNMLAIYLLEHEIDGVAEACDAFTSELTAWHEDSFEVTLIIACN